MPQNLPKLQTILKLTDDQINEIHLKQQIFLSMNAEKLSVLGFDATQYSYYRFDHSESLEYLLQNAESVAKLHIPLKTLLRSNVQSIQKLHTYSEAFRQLGFYEELERNFEAFRNYPDNDLYKAIVEHVATLQKLNIPWSALANAYYSSRETLEGLIQHSDAIQHLNLSDRSMLVHLDQRELEYLIQESDHARKVDVVGDVVSFE